MRAPVEMRRPRVLLAGINYEPEETGIAVNTTGMAEGLAARGWDVAVLTGIPHYPAWRPGPVPPRRAGAAVRVTRRRHFVPARPSLSGRGAYELSWVTACLPEVVRRHRVDVVMGVVPTLGGAVLGAMAASRERVPLVLVFQDLLGRAARQSRVRSGATVAGAVQAAELFLARRAERVAVVAEGFRHYLVEGGVADARIQRIRNPVRIPRPQLARGEVRRWLGWGEEEIVVLHSGNMGFKQALENVVLAARLAGADRRIRFVLQGDGSRREAVRRLARELAPANLEFRPLAPAGELADVLAAADLLLLNQGAEVVDMSLPAKLTCYFAVGVPVVAAVAAGSEAALEVAAAGAGVLVEPERPDLLLAAIRDLASEPARRRALGEAGRRFADAHLSADAAIDGVESALRGALEARR